jgi:hypothetical protein
MTRPYSPYDTSSRERFGEHSPQPGQYDPDSSFRSRYRSSYDSGYRSGDAGASYEDSVDYDAYAVDGHDGDSDDDIYEYYEPVDKRWMWVASVAGVILLVAVICTVIILGGGDSGSVSAVTTSPAEPSTSQSPTTAVQDATSKPVPAPPGPAMSPETVTTVTPSPRATAEPTAEPAPPEAAPPASPADPRTITYTVTGTRPLLDLVTIVYTDQQGALQTDINVALPWTKTVTLNPGVQLKSVTATSVTGQLNCAITDANGAVLVQQANNTMIATCTQ